MLPIKIEEAALNAWPSLNTYIYDGWLLRFANGYTKRANSVTPLYAGCESLEEKIEWCAKMYEGKGLRSIFRLPSFHPDAARLDTLLEAAGYERIDETSVQTMELEDPLSVSEHEIYNLSDRSGRESWLRSFHELSGAYRTDSETHERMLDNIVGDCCYMVLMNDNEVVACGLAVFDRGYLGLFDIVTAEEQRHKGFATRLVKNLLNWGIDRGAVTSYLQVMRNTTAAQRLYAKLGFEEIYRYGYRVLNDASAR